MYYQVCSCSNDTPGLTLTYFTAMSNFVPYLPTMVVYDIKVGRYSQLNEYMKL